MKICVFHARMGHALGAALREALPTDDEVFVTTDTSQDPPCAGELDVLIANTFPPGMLGRCPKLRWLQLTGAGVDHVASGNPTAGLVVSHAGSVPARAVAEFAWMGILGLAKQAPALVRQQGAREWKLADARLLAGSTLVIVGLGSIGQEIAKRARGFEVHTVAITQSGSPSALVDEVRPSSKLPDAARDADTLVIAVPATPSTTRPPLIDAKVIGALPSGAALINVARASVLDTGAVVQALRDKRLSAALLDVFDEEPLPPESPLWSVDGLWVTPHSAFRYPGEAADLARLLVENVGRFRAKAPLLNQVALSAAAPAKLP